MIGISGKRGVTVIGGVALLAVVILAVALVSSTGAAKPKCKYAFGGSWLFLEEPGEFNVLTEAPLDIVGKREASVRMQPLGPDDPTYGYFPTVVAKSRRVGRLVATGKDTFEYNSLAYGLDEDNLVVYIMITGGSFEWVDCDTRVGELWASFYLASQDADGDGLPDEGEEPIACFGGLGPYTFRRVPWYTMPCE